MTRWRFKRIKTAARMAQAAAYLLSETEATG